MNIRGMLLFFSIVAVDSIEQTRFEKILATTRTYSVDDVSVSVRIRLQLTQWRFLLRSSKPLPTVLVQGVQAAYRENIE